MTTTLYAGLLGIGSAVVVFFTSLLELIYNMAVDGIIQAQVFIGGLFLVFGVMLYNKATKNVWVVERGSTKWLLGILCVTLLVGPYFISGAYAASGSDVYLDYPVMDADIGSGGWYAQYVYWNTTGDKITTELTEACTANGTFGVGTLSATAQDLDEYTAIWISLSATFIWNLTAFDNTHDEYITAIGLRVTTDSGSHLYTLDFGSSDSTYTDLFWDDKLFTGADMSTATRMAIPTSVAAQIADLYPMIGASSLRLKIQEENAAEFVNGATPVFELWFYSNAYGDQFLEYLLLFGSFYVVLGLIATKTVKIPGSRRRRSRYRGRARRWRSRRRRR